MAVSNADSLKSVCYSYPAIDNHAHALLSPNNRSALPFEGLISEAEGDALTQDAPHTLACFRATAALAKLYGVDESEATWDAVKAAREKIGYADLCKMCFGRESRIQCIFIDDGFGTRGLAAEYRWHDSLTQSPTKRLVRIEEVAQRIFPFHLNTVEYTLQTVCNNFLEQLTEELQKSASDPEVVGFKSIACYRTGLDIELSCTPEDLQKDFFTAVIQYITAKEVGDRSPFRLAEKHLNDHIVRVALGIAAECNKPIQFHTGLGDSDIRLSLSSPSHMQPLIEAFPKTKFVLLHSSYPFTREAGYLTAMYKNVFLDFGEVFPFVSADGQRSIIRQVLELAPTNKIMWSTDGHWWPESYYLGSVQARHALYEVLNDFVTRGEMTERQAISTVKNALFHNANRVYNLGLEPILDGSGDRLAKLFKIISV